MKTNTVSHLLALLLVVPAIVTAAEPEAKKDITIRRHALKGEASPFHMKFEGGDSAEMEKVAYLGVETMPVDPTVAAQLGLARGTGIVVRRVAEGSPAEGVLQAHDVLTKLDDQILVNMAQLTVLVRNRRMGDEVKLTYVRAGKEAVAKVKLGEHEVPKLSWQATSAGPGMPAFGQVVPFGGAHNMTFGRAFSAMPALPVSPDAEDVMRTIGGDRMHWFAQPRVHVLRRAGGAGSTILDMAAGNFVFSDGDGSVEVNAADGKRDLTVKDKDGKITFQGSINTPEERDNLPPEVKERIEAIGGAEFGPGMRDIKVETQVFEPASQVRFHLQAPPRDEADAPEAGMRTL